MEISYKLSVEPKELTREEIEGISDEHEREFALTAIDLGMQVKDGGMISLDSIKKRKGDKRSTNPDFLIENVFVEITKGENLGSRKSRQKKVMETAGLPYIQLTGSQIESLRNEHNKKEAIEKLLGIRNKNDG